MGFCCFVRTYVAHVSVVCVVSKCRYSRTIVSVNFTYTIFTWRAVRLMIIRSFFFSLACEWDWECLCLFSPSLHFYILWTFSAAAITHVCKTFYFISLCFCCCCRSLRFGYEMKSFSCICVHTASFSLKLIREIIVTKMRHRKHWTNYEWAWKSAITRFLSLGLVA